jgi:hypothetical protein
MIRALFGMIGAEAPAPALNEAEWRELLKFADRTQLTLHLHGKSGLPAWLAEEIEARYVRNAERRRRLRDTYAEVSDALRRAGIDFVLLKGFTHESGLDGSGRVQYDLDLLTLPHDIGGARAALQPLGYEPHGAQSLSAEHSRPLVKPSGWSWRGDYFDPDMPIPVELHESVWSAERDRIHPSGIDAFWSRRGLIEVNGLQIPAFADVDRLAFAALHALRHILRHDAKPAHVLELARFLEIRQDDGPFWQRWLELHSPELRDLQAVAFRFATEWFEATLPASAATQPQSMETWFENFAWSPVANLAGANKDTVWLHLALVKNWRDRVRVFCERMLPLRLPHEKLSGRLRYHAGALAPALASGVRWWWRRETASTASEISDWKRRRV